MTIPPNQMSVTADYVNIVADNLFEMPEDFTIRVSIAGSQSYLLVGNSVTIVIMDDGQSPGEWISCPHAHAGARERIGV